jgi:hypothetical protein
LRLNHLLFTYTPEKEAAGGKLLGQFQVEKPEKVKAQSRAHRFQDLLSRVAPLKLRPLAPINGVERPVCRRSLPRRGE